jgi:surface protein
VRRATGDITTMKDLFQDKGNFNEDITGWILSSVTDVTRMFCRADSFNQPIGSWDMGRVTTMTQMFLGARAFNKPIGGWDTSSVTNMAWMFWTADAFSQDLSSWCVSSISSEPSIFGNPGTDPTWGSCPCRTLNAANVNCVALTDSNIGTARDLWFSDEAACVTQYGHIARW